MGWLKVDDKMPRNPKVLAGTVETSWYYVCALSHCAEQMTDGFIADSAVPLIAPHIHDPRSVADTCCELGLFRQVDRGYMIPGYLEFNPSRESVMAKRADDAERQRKKRERESQGESQRDTDATSGVSPGVPSRPVPPDTSHHLSTATTGDVSLIEEAANLVVQLRFQRQTNVRSPKRWQATCLANLRTEDGGMWWAELERLCTEYPTAPASMIAGAAEGEPSRHLHMHRREAS